MIAYIFAVLVGVTIGLVASAVVNRILPVEEDDQDEIH